MNQPSASRNVTLANLGELRPAAREPARPASPQNVFQSSSQRWVSLATETGEATASSLSRRLFDAQPCRCRILDEIKIEDVLTGIHFRPKRPIFAVSWVNGRCAPLGHHNAHLIHPHDGPKLFLASPKGSISPFGVADTESGR